MDIYNLIQNSNTTNTKLWQDKSVSFGVSKNKPIEQMLISHNILVKNKNIDDAFLRNNVIHLPLKTKFENANNYYHLVLHEFAHFKSDQLQQNEIYRNACEDYYVKFGYVAHPVKLVQEHSSLEKLAKADKTVFNVVVSYLHEESKCELAALQIMDHSKIKADKLDLNHTGMTLGIANDLLKSVGRDLQKELADGNSPIRKELKTLSDSMCKDYDMAKEQVLTKSRERER